MNVSWGKCVISCNLYEKWFLRNIWIKTENVLKPVRSCYLLFVHSLCLYCHSLTGGDEVKGFLCCPDLKGYCRLWDLVLSFAVTPCSFLHSHLLADSTTTTQGWYLRRSPPNFILGSQLWLSGRSRGPTSITSDVSTAAFSGQICLWNVGVEGARRAVAEEKSPSQRSHGCVRPSFFLSSVKSGNEHDVVLVLQLVLQLPLRCRKTHIDTHSIFKHLPGLIWVCAQHLGSHWPPINDKVFISFASCVASVIESMDSYWSLSHCVCV